MLRIVASLLLLVALTGASGAAAQPAETKVFLLAVATTGTPPCEREGVEADSEYETRAEGECLIHWVDDLRVETTVVKITNLDASISLRLRVEGFRPGARVVEVLLPSDGSKTPWQWVRVNPAAGSPSISLRAFYDVWGTQKWVVEFYTPTH